MIGKPVADDRYVYYVSLDNVLRAMNQVTGGQQWMRPLPIRPAWGAMKAGSTIVVKRKNEEEVDIEVIPPVDMPEPATVGATAATAESEGDAPSEEDSE